MAKRIKSRHAVQALAVGVAACLGIDQAHAVITYTIGGTVGVDLEDGWSLTIDGANDPRALVGNIKLIPASGPTINTVCTDVSGTVYLGSQYTYEVKSFASAPASGLSPVWGFDNGGVPYDTTTKTYGPYDHATANAAIQNAAYIFALHSSVLIGASLSDKAALQLAVWTALYDTGSGINWTTEIASGRFHAGVGTSGDGAALTTALGWLNSALGTTGTAAHQQYSGNLLIPNPEIQHGLIPQEMLLTPTPVPEPTTILAGLLLLLPFGASTLRFVRKHKAA